ncbi:MAG TPA: hypothetical protein GYA07_09395 [Verrucomicrobia bacterium]|nr:hypothetical protein [Verrucomicrobiota bacterium]HOP98914.1 saccharopine dehydrogenase NADP-binding domain-containing protein [Verrucomicrobiota bacterium]
MRLKNRERSSDAAVSASDGGARPPHLLILGASGHVAQAFLHRLQARRGDFGNLVLLDRDDRVVRDPYLDHSLLDYSFVHRPVQLPDDTAEYHRLLREHEIDVVVDLTDLDTLPVLKATDAAGVSYLNTSMNGSGMGIADLVAQVHPVRNRRRRAAHILSSGMNPGVVNIWVWHGFRQHGRPSRIVHFEYDTSVPVSGWRPIITWSRKEFLAETVWESTGEVIGGKVSMRSGNSLQHREDLRPVMEPVIELPAYPWGMLVLHEENVKLGMKLGVSSKYVYAIHPRTMAYMEQLVRRRGGVAVDDLELGDNTSVPLAGSDTIGVCLDYPDKSVYYVHTMANEDVTRTNATCAQVAVGVDAALQALRLERLAPRIYFASDLYGTVYSDVIFSSLRVDEHVFERVNGELVRRAEESRLHPAFAGTGKSLATA